MSVYVDALMNFGWKLGPSCHMFADTLEELHVMAEKIGMKRVWFQCNTNRIHQFPHYDLVKSRRDRAVSFGAISLNNREGHDVRVRLGFTPAMGLKGEPVPPEKPFQLVAQ